LVIFYAYLLIMLYIIYIYIYFKIKKKSFSKKLWYSETFDTLPELMDRKFNRPHIETLKKTAITNVSDNDHEIRVNNL